VSDKRLASIALGLMGSAIVGGAVWVRDMDVRVALLEDDLTETVETMAILHPIADAQDPPEWTLTAPKGREQAYARQRLLEQLRESPVLDDDDSSGDDDSAADTEPPPKQES